MIARIRDALRSLWRAVVGPPLVPPRGRRTPWIRRCPYCEGVQVLTLPEDRTCRQYGDGWFVCDLCGKVDRP